jgi:hypothetical protein
MDQTLLSRQADRDAESRKLIEFIEASIGAARVGQKPFYHLELENVFPAALYAAMLNSMPVLSDYRPMHGRSRNNDLADGTHTRVKIDLFPEYIHHLPQDKLMVWSVVGKALRSKPVIDAFRRMLAPALERRFGRDYASCRLYAVPILTRDFPGYRIKPHTDTHWKGITVQLYLPRDDSNIDVGTIFHRCLPNNALAKAKQIPFAPNSGYAFAVDNDTWHSADEVHDRVDTRDSILLTYYLDRKPVEVISNRGKRLGNFLLNEVRNWT